MADETELHYLEQAWRDWLASDEGQKCASGTAEGEYLKNRLWRAFMAGAEAETEKD